MQVKSQDQQLVLIQQQKAPPKMAETLWYVSIPLLLSIVLMIQYSAKAGLINITNFYIPDSYTYELRSFSESNFDGFSSVTYNIFNQLLYRIGSPSFLICNTIILLLSIKLCRNIFQHVSLQAVTCSRLAIVLNPYLLIGAIGPNKEIILMFICLLFWSCTLNLKGRIRLPIIFLIALSPVLIRAVVAIPLLLSIIAGPALRKTNKPMTMSYIFLGIFFIFNSTPLGNSIISGLQDDDIISFQESRIYMISLQLREYSKNLFLQYPAFIGKSVLILFAPIFRPLRLFDSQIALLDIGYSFMAYCLLPFNLAMSFFFLKGLHFKKSLEKQAISETSFFTVISVLCVILNSTITFRYIFPYLPFIFPFFTFQSPKWQKLCIVLSIFMISMSIPVAQINLGNSTPSVSTDVIPRFMEWL